MRYLLVLILLALSLPVAAAEPSAAEKPNVILIIVDDQGYGDIAAHGNPVVKTPHLDKLHSESIRLTDYHTDPTCSPTRAALLTGRYSTRVGVTHTINGRSLLPGDELTLAEVFKANGYRTGMFGKWHLGANAPMRPMDQGFDHCVWSPGGAVNQGANWLGNDCTDDTYKVNEKWQQFPGYHTDVWFNQATKFIGETEKNNKPFFIYLPTTAVHDPHNVDDKYAKPYRDAGVPPGMSKFYGMITNLDENLGRLRAYLDENGLAENTILIFTTDNGTTAGWIDRNSGFKYFNAGMRGWKGSQWDGGHRVPFFMHWPKGGMDKGKDVGALIAHFDVMPTLVEMLKLNKPEGKPLDGISVLPALEGDPDALPERTIFVGVQRRHEPKKWDRTVAMKGTWRLVNGEELYHIRRDPGQQTDLADKRPEEVAMMRQDYDNWWEEMEPSFNIIARFDLGGAENPTTLMSHDWYMKPGEGDSAWHHSYVKRNELRNGAFAVNVVKAGKYRITPMRWPEYVDKPSGCTQAQIAIQGSGHQSQMASSQDPAERISGFEIQLPAGPAFLTSTLTREDGKTFGAYYVKIEYLGDEE